MYEIRLENSAQLLEIFELCENEALAKILLEKLGGVELLVNKIVAEYKDIPPTNDSLKDIYILGELIFSTVGSSTYAEDWDKWFEYLRPLPVGYLIMLISNWCPKRHCDELSDSTLSYLLSCYYNSDLTQQIYDEISEFFEREELEPTLFEQFKKKIHFIDELALFDDVSFIEKSYTDFSFETTEILEILKGIILARKLNDFNQIELFIRLVKWYAPSKSVLDTYKYRSFVLEVFETDDESGVEMFSTNTFQIIQEYFYDVNFMDTSDEIKQLYQITVENEANHISSMQKKYPNYRHD